MSISGNKSYPRFVFIISLSLNVILAGYFAGKRVYYSNEKFFYKHFGIKQDIPNTSIDRWKSFLSSKPDTAAIIFSGTSLTDGFRLQNAFHNAHIKNLGFAWNTTHDLEWQISHYIIRHPQKIFLEGGINDIRHGISLDIAFNNFVQICEIIKTQSPGTKLYVQSVLPTGNAEYNKLIKAYNYHMIGYCVKNQVSYINLYPEFYRYGQIDNSLTTDGIHLNATGYFLWRKLIEEYVVR